MDIYLFCLNSKFGRLSLTLDQNLICQMSDCQETEDLKGLFNKR
jgi:hypothetical protein